LGIFLIVYIISVFNSQKGAIMAVHILNPITQGYTTITSSKTVDNTPNIEKALAELKEKFDTYNKEVKEHNEKVIKEFEEQSTEEDDEHENDLEDDVYNRNVKAMIALYDSCLRLVNSLESLKTIF